MSFPVQISSLAWQSWDSRQTLHTFAFFPRLQNALLCEGEINIEHTNTHFCLHCSHPEFSTITKTRPKWRIETGAVRVNKQLNACAEFAWFLLSSGSPGDGPLTTVLIEIMGCEGSTGDKEEIICRFAFTFTVHTEIIFVAACSKKRRIFWRQHFRLF